jgi:hypothetical protein
MADPSTARRMNPIILIVHLNPTCGRSCFAAIGKSVPPRDDPTATNPMASPRRFLNQCATADAVGAKMQPHGNFKYTLLEGPVVYSRV